MAWNLNSESRVGQNLVEYCSTLKQPQIQIVDDPSLSARMGSKMDLCVSLYTTPPVQIEDDGACDCSYVCVRRGGHGLQNGDDYPWDLGFWGAWAKSVWNQVAERVGWWSLGGVVLAAYDWGQRSGRIHAWKKGEQDGRRDRRAYRFLSSPRIAYASLTA